jgi:hypothetical protein
MDKLIYQVGFNYVLKVNYYKNNLVLDPVVGWRHCFENITVFLSSMFLLLIVVSMIMIVDKM